MKVEVGCKVKLDDDTMMTNIKRKLLYIYPALVVLLLTFIYNESFWCSEKMLLKENNIMDLYLCLVTFGFWVCLGRGL